MMDEFMQQPAHMQPTAATPFAMEQMRRDFESHNIGAQQQQRSDSPQWMDASWQAAKMQQPGLNPAEFERFGQINSMNVVPRTASPMVNESTMNTYQRPMGMGYGGMGMSGGMNYGGMGLYGGQSFIPMTQAQQPMEQQQSKGKGRMVELDEQDWEAQFAELDSADQTHAQENALDAAAMEAELDAMDRSVHPDMDHFGDFEMVWEQIKAETLANRDMLGNDHDAWRSHTGDFNDWDKFDSTLNAHLRDPELGDYLFEPAEDNIFSSLGDPFGEGVRIMDSGGNLSLAALAFEAAVQKDPLHIDAWTRLGAAQAQNEKETPAIRALEQALKLDPSNLDALMGLAVSYTNEGYDTTAYRTLERWLSTKYPSIAPPESQPSDPYHSDLGFTDRHLLHEKVTNLFIAAAQLSPDPTTMDPDVQVGLGVLFYGAEDFDKAVDCFSAALASSESGSSNAPERNARPLLWNRLGATLANSGRSEEAIDAYEHALELNPNFVRARYNLGVSCINIGCYEEAAQHLLGALAMHGVVEREGREKAKQVVGGGAGGPSINDEDLDRMIRQNQSTNLYDTLRRVFGQMGRKDLVERMVGGVDVDSFRGEFDFVKP